MSLNEEQTLYLIRVLQQRHRSMPSSWLRTELELMRATAMELILRLTGGWWLQRHGGSANHEWHTIAKYSEYSAVRKAYEETKKEIQRGAVAIIYSPVAQRLRPVELKFYLADENDAERVRRRTDEERTEVPGGA